MNGLSIDPKLLGSFIVSTRGDRRRIIAAWLESPSKYNTYSTNQFTVLAVGDCGEVFRVILPDTSWAFEVPFAYQTGMEKY